MKCPSCKQDLLMTERQGIEIDYCGACSGVWLDRGELEKFIQFATQCVTVKPFDADDNIDERRPAYRANSVPNFKSKIARVIQARYGNDHPFCRM